MLTFSRIAVVIALVQVTLSVPLKMKYEGTAAGTATQANQARLDAAATLANSQIANMRKGLDKAKAGEPKAKALYEAAFGKAGTNSDITKVDQTVKALETGTLTAKLAAHPFRNGEIASVPWEQAKKGDPWVPGAARFSKQFHGDGQNPLDANGRAGTLIHEATHQLKATGDEVHKTTGKILRADEDNKDAHASSTGYTSAANMHKTVADVKKDTKFTGVRNAASNMHDNAESYAVFASLCSQPGALRRRDVHLFNRALVERDDEQLEYLARRNSCKLPPNYFAKKAAAKKAEAAKNGAKSPVVAKKTQLSGKRPSKATSKLRTAAGKVSKVSKVATGLKQSRIGVAPKGAKGRAVVKSKVPSAARPGAKPKALSKAKANVRKPVKASPPAKKISPKAGSRSKVAASRKSVKATGAPKKSAPKARAAKTPRGSVVGARKTVKAAHPAKKITSKARPATRGKVNKAVQPHKSPKPVRSAKPHVAKGQAKVAPKSRVALKGIKPKAPARRVTPAAGRAAAKPKVAKVPARAAKGRVTPSKGSVKAKVQARPQKVALKAKVAPKVATKPAARKAVPPKPKAAAVAPKGKKH